MVKFGPIFFLTNLSIMESQISKMLSVVDSQSIAKIALNALGIVPTTKVSLETA